MKKAVYYDIIKNAINLIERRLMNILKIKKIFIYIIIIFITIQCLSINAYAESNNNQFKFGQSLYSLRGEYDNKAINIILPNGYTMNDVEITSENEDIVQVVEFLNKNYIEAIGIGETRLKATIKSTDYVTYCDVKVEEPIIMNLSRKNLGATLEIDTYSPYLWDIRTTQAFEISVTPLNYEGQEKWIRLGEGNYGSALNRKYSYDITENCIVAVRWVSWWNGMYYNGESELFRKTIIIDTIVPYSSIGAKIKIYASDYNETSSTINIDDTLKLNAGLVEIPSDTPITWKSYQENVATVDSNGVVKGLREGTARIEATATVRGLDGNTITYKDVYPVIIKNDNKITIQQTLTNNGAASGIIPDNVTVGNTEQALIYADGLNVSWSSSNEEIATVDENGLIQGIANGKANINANVDYNNTTYCIAQEINVSGGKTDNTEGEVEDTENKKESGVENQEKNKENDKKQDNTVTQKQDNTVTQKQNNTVTQKQDNTVTQKQNSTVTQKQASTVAQKQDNTVANKQLPYAGKSKNIIIAISMTILAMIILFVIYKRYKDIKY